MDEHEIEMDIITDEELSKMIQEIDPDYEYEKYRDEWCDRLYDALKQVYNDFVLPKKHGYYAQMPEKFLEHAIGSLQDITGCEANIREHNIIVKREENKIMEEEHEVSPKIKS